MLNHSSLTGATELHTRKLQAAGVLTTLARMKATSEMAAEDSATLNQGLELLDHLMKGQQLFADAPVTRQLVGEGIAFLAAARALNFADKDKLDECKIYLTQMRSTLDAIMNSEPVSSEQQGQLDKFLTDFARVLQADMNVGRAQRHIIPTRM